MRTSMRTCIGNSLIFEVYPTERYQDRIIQAVDSVIQAFALITIYSVSQVAQTIQVAEKLWHNDRSTMFHNCLDTIHSATRT